MRNLFLHEVKLADWEDNPMLDSVYHLDIDRCGGAHRFMHLFGRLLHMHLESQPEYVVSIARYLREFHYQLSSDGTSEPIPWTFLI